MTNWGSAATFAPMVGLIITASAAAETVGTACLSKATGEIYSLAPFRSTPSMKCGDSDQTVRVSLHQPNTSFAKRHQSTDGPAILPDFGRGAMAVFGPSPGATDLLIYLEAPTDRPTLPSDNCTLMAIDLNLDRTHVIASVPPNSFQEGLDTVTVIDGEDGVVIRTYDADRTIFTDQGALVFHDLIVDYGGASLRSGTACFASFLVEYAADPQQLYEK